MTPRYLRVTMYVLAALTIPIMFLLALWAQSWGIPYSGMLTRMDDQRVELAFYAITVPAFAGLCAMACGLTGLIVPHYVSFPAGREISFSFVCLGFIATGFLWGAMFLQHGPFPINWVRDDYSALFFTVIAEYLLAVILVRIRMNDDRESSPGKEPVAAIE